MSTKSNYSVTNFTHLFYLELCFYSLNFVYFYFYLLPLIGEDVAELCYSDRHCVRRVRQDWFLKHSIDLSDGQWKEFRQSLGFLIATMIIVSLLNAIVQKLLDAIDINATNKIFVKQLIRIVVGIIALLIQHGYQSGIILFLCILGYFIAQSKVKSFVWLYGIAILLFKESYRVQHFENFEFLKPFFDRKYSGMYGWQFPANFLALRILSYGLDYINHCNSSATVSNIMRKDTKKSDSIDSNEIIAEKESLLHQDYNFINMLAYLLYIPLYMAGPIINYDMFVSQSKGVHTKLVPQENVFFYGIRLLFAMGLMEYFTFKLPFFAIISSGLVRKLDPGQLAMVLYMVLKMMWLKFLIIWRFFRLWAMFDGITPPENMLKCMSNNYSLESFWRGWHASFNKWIIRYMYIPLGGNSNKILSVLIVFIFVAVWHDFEMKLLVWGILNSVFYFIEVYSKRFMLNSSFMKSLPVVILNGIEVLSGSTYIIVLISVNLIGYAVGIGGISMIFEKLLTRSGLLVIGVSYYFLSVAICLMKFLKKHGFSKS
eukprot:gene10182-13699_t